MGKASLHCKGLGKYLLNKSLKRVVVEEKPIIVEADPHSEKFYSKQGFQTFGKRQSYPEDRLLPLMKRIQPPLSRKPGKPFKNSCFILFVPLWQPVQTNPRISSNCFPLSPAKYLLRHPPAPRPKLPFLTRLRFGLLN